MADVMQRFRPDVVFHAAAYKHVSLTEENPLEAVRNNAIGTRVCAAAAAAVGTARFVLVSTDKAVNPATALGASKAMAEWVVEALGRRHPGTVFCSVRFGNVLGSSGSVVPLFRRQIEQGGPVTVTAPRDAALLHDDSRVRAADHQGRPPRERRRDLRARDGRAGEDHRPRAQHDQAVRPGPGRGTDRDHRPAAGREAARGAVPPGGAPGPHRGGPYPAGRAAAARSRVGGFGVRARRAAGASSATRRFWPRRSASSHARHTGTPAARPRRMPART